MAYIGENAIEIEPVATDEGLAPLARLILSQLPACDDLLIRQQLGATLREFCRETDACVVEQFTRARDGRFLHGCHCFPVAAIPQGMVLGTVLEVRVNGHEVPFDVEKFPAPTVRIRRVICEDDNVLIRFSTYPKVGGEVCPKWFLDRYAEAITAGTMYNLLSMSKRGWSDPQRAAQFGATYQGAISEAAYRRLHGDASDSGQMSAVPCGGLFM